VSVPKRGPRHEAVDGRALRAERSRRAIVEALHDLVGAGTLVPTAQQVAERAHVGLRTVFRHFSDMESLFAELDRRIRDEVQPLVESEPPAAPLRARLLALARRRATLYERVGPYLRATRLQRGRSAFLERRARSSARELREELRRWLPELERRRELLEPLDLLLSFELWDRLRSEQRLGVQRALGTLEPLLLHLARLLEDET
jgi:AcrR family transcriptional regulator